MIDHSQEPDDWQHDPLCDCDGKAEIRGAIGFMLEELSTNAKGLSDELQALELAIEKLNG